MAPSDHIKELPVLPQHLQPVAELWSPLHDEVLRMSLDLREVASLVTHKLGPREHLLQAIKHIRPEKVPGKL